jgi:hypothetical protein
VARAISANKDGMYALQPRLKESFERLFKASRVDYALGETGTTIRLYHHLPEFMKLSFDSVISLPYSFVSKLKDNPAFSEKEASELREIASRMAPIMKEETDFVKSNYRW